MNQKKILLTGCAGLIGAETARQLIALGHKIVGIDNLNDYYDVRIKKHRLETYQQAKNFKFIQGDIEDLKLLESLFSEHSFDVVLNLAARAGVRYSMEHPEIYLSTNTTGSLNLLQMMQKHKVKKIVLASTSSLYAGQKMPFTEDLAVNTPISPYAATKKAAELMAHTYHYLYGIDVSIVRYFTVYGPAGRPDMSIFRFIKWIDEQVPLTLYGDGAQARDFTYVEDIARGTILAMKEIGYEIINLGGGNNPIDLNTIIDMIENILGKKAIRDQKPFHIADIKATWADISKAKKLLGWEPKTSLETGIKNSIEWYLKNKSWVSSIHV
jgi:nucleoside-diphosphate-sugar epimerase